MDILIIGSDKTSQRLAYELSEQGHDLTVLSKNEDELNLIEAHLPGCTALGNPLDRDVLETVGGSELDVAVVLTEDDNTNAMSSQILKYEFNISNVYTRVFDTTREKIFRKLGLTTVCPTGFEVGNLLGLITNSSNKSNTAEIGGFFATFEEIPVEHRDLGRSPAEIVHRVNDMPFAIKHADGGVDLANKENLLLKKGDIIIFAKIN